MCEKNSGSLLPLSDLSETLFETGLSQPARFSSKGNKGIQKLKRVVGLTFTETAGGEYLLLANL